MPLLLPNCCFWCEIGVSMLSTSHYGCYIASIVSMEGRVELPKNDVILTENTHIPLWFPPIQHCWSSHCCLSFSKDSIFESYRWVSVDWLWYSSPNGRIGCSWACLLLSPSRYLHTFHFHSDWLAVIRIFSHCVVLGDCRIRIWLKEPWIRIRIVDVSVQHCNV